MLINSYYHIEIKVVMESSVFEVFPPIVITYSKFNFAWFLNHRLIFIVCAMKIMKRKVQKHQKWQFLEGKKLYFMSFSIMFCQWAWVELQNLDLFHFQQTTCTKTMSDPSVKDKEKKAFVFLSNKNGRDLLFSWTMKISDVSHPGFYSMIRWYNGMSAISNGMPRLISQYRHQEFQVCL